MKPLALDEFKQGVADFYNCRSRSYDQGQWHPQICDRLLEYARIGAGQTVLDIGTGTGYLAIASARLVGEQGHVTGVDISSGMLKQAQRKIQRLGLSNVVVQRADAEALDYPSHHFDAILCAHTFPWMTDKASTLRLWYQLLKPKGRIAVHTPADTAYIGAVVLRRVLAEYGLELEPSNRLGSIEQCRQLFEKAGFETVEIHTEQHGSYKTLDQAKAIWESVAVNPSITAPKVVGDGLSRFSAIELAKIKAELYAELEALQTEQGLWNDLTTVYILADKPEPHCG
ncbi:class I SAM-dependent methyltransferase [Acaryochloris sp. CCMEE 5410]|uniref:class I SAM-dependent methyltransferase n=1 Tax=Acaryochloris sp. CCMEE 5410 TaxID=310037 RepID=UPI0002484A28|nr:methyltransferase domain-containing protein [Acaryochloris sp. CCMEE 5410]KAI9134484.1 methyltransferase domain-containing protein [Acaryochloris sp. CCMEE 5410]